jgi:hypothetical protein
MVRLRLLFFRLYFLQFVVFKFQYGTIKTYTIEGEAVLHSEFKFQYGTIKTEIERNILAVLTHLNSNMVRLRQKSNSRNYKKI